MAAEPDQKVRTSGSVSRADLEVDGFMYYDTSDTGITQLPFKMNFSSVLDRPIMRVR